MDMVRPKKNLGQHFLTDQNIARKIVDSLGTVSGDVLEIGPGMGILTRFLLKRTEISLHTVEIDKESVAFLKETFPELIPTLYQEDFLKMDFSKFFPRSFSVIGNFPYNISSQIFFKILDNRKQIPEVVGMVQKEVAERMAAKPGSKTYGILSVLLQVYYQIEYLFTVHENVFNPPPKVKSAVIRLTRNNTKELPCNEDFFKTIVKTSFNFRRKMLRNSLRNICNPIPAEFAEKRPEQLSLNDFIELTCKIEHLLKNE